MQEYRYLNIILLYYFYLLSYEDFSFTIYVYMYTLCCMLKVLYCSPSFALLRLAGPVVAAGAALDGARVAGGCSHTSGPAAMSLI